MATTRRRHLLHCDGCRQLQPVSGFTLAPRRCGRCQERDFARMARFIERHGAVVPARLWRELEALAAAVEPAAATVG